MTWVKVCGVTHRKHVTAAIDAGADALGVVCWEGSPRNVTEEVATDLVGLSTVPVFLLTVDMTSSTVLALAHRIGVTGVQPYGRDAATIGREASDAGLEVIMPNDGTTTVPAGQIPLIDSGSDTRPGGTGRRLDWESLDGAQGRWILAGGLTPENVAEAIMITGAWGVDVSSGVEATRGIKSPRLIKRFLTEAKQ